MHKEKKPVLLLTILLSLCLAACGSDSEDMIATSSDAQTAVYITPTTGAPGGIKTSLDLCNEERIMALVSSYYNAMENHDTSAVASLVSDSSMVSGTIFDKFQDVTDVQVKKMYVINGSSPIDKIIYVYYEVKILDISTSVPSLDELYISEADGTPKIYNGAVGESVYTQIKKLQQDEGVIQLVSSVNSAFNNALEKDEALSKYFNPNE